MSIADWIQLSLLAIGACIVFFSIRKEKKETRQCSECSNFGFEGGTLRNGICFVCHAKDAEIVRRALEEINNINKPIQMPADMIYVKPSKLQKRQRRYSNVLAKSGSPRWKKRSKEV